MSDVSAPPELADLRRPSRDRALEPDRLPPAPMDTLAAWYEEALAAGALEPNAMVISTVDASGQPSSRAVLMKYLDAEGPVFFTNYDSRKAHEIAGNAKVSALFFWPAIERQLQIRGVAERIGQAASLRYFLRRPRESQIGAWVSHQSQVVSSRSILEAKFEEMKRRFASGEVPLPSFWGGYRVRPLEVELWQGRAHRLHDRFLYARDGDGWRLERLAP
ncbi:MAG: pyridoxamine 5'-phosphate oxidase [Myxococcales bacterium]|nr:pyridoxamine 5'-phosphate oxidase [Myxococcales bacterium]